MPEAFRANEIVNYEKTALSLGTLTLAHFRNYEDLRLQVNTAPIVLTGANGSGKTNLLEAISMLVPGRGLRRAPLNELQNQNAPEPRAVAADLVTPLGAMQIGTARDTDETEAERRIIHIDGKTVRGQHALAEHVAMAWI